MRRKEHIELIGGQWLGSVFHDFNTELVEVNFYVNDEERLDVTNCFDVNRDRKYVSWSLPGYYDFKPDSVICVIRKRKWEPPYVK